MTPEQELLIINIGLWLLFIVPTMIIVYEMRWTDWNEYLYDIPALINNQLYPLIIGIPFTKSKDGSYEPLFNELWLYEPGMRVMIKEYWFGDIEYQIIHHIYTNKGDNNYGQIVFKNGSNSHYTNIKSFFFESETDKIIDSMLSILDLHQENRQSRPRPVPAIPAPDDWPRVVITRQTEPNEEGYRTREYNRQF